VTFGDGDGGVTVAVDEDAAPEGFSAELEFKSLAAFVPTPARCAAAPVTVD
jgi:hypothetical protein